MYLFPKINLLKMQNTNYKNHSEMVKKEIKNREKI